MSKLLRSGLAALFAGAAGAYFMRRELYALTLRLPPPQYDVDVRRDIPIAMHDGILLLADHYYPRAIGTFPTVWSVVAMVAN